MKDFMEVTTAKGDKELIRTENIDYITYYCNSETVKSEIHFTIGQKDKCLLVRETFASFANRLNGFIEVTAADGGKALIKIENIDYITPGDSETSKTLIYFKIQHKDEALYVRETFAEVVAKIKAATV